MIAKVRIDEDVRDSHCNRKKGGEFRPGTAADFAYGNPTKLLLERVVRVFPFQRP